MTSAEDRDSMQRLDTVAGHIDSIRRLMTRRMSRAEAEAVFYEEFEDTIDQIGGMIAAARAVYEASFAPLEDALVRQSYFRAYLVADATARAAEEQGVYEKAALFRAEAERLLTASRRS